MEFGRIALIGSGELTPSMVEVHKELLADANRGGGAFFLDTPAGFQPNVDDISTKAHSYFRKNVQHRLETVSFKSASEATDYDLQLVLEMIESGDYLLVGPGSPTYMLAQLENNPVTLALVNLVRGGGSLAIASAAALTAGSNTLPVYEIYKVGEPLHWLPGLNLLGFFGLEMVVMPHWNNGEGGSHDTRFCYMGRQRFDKLRALLPAGTRYLGIDEHTACVLDFNNDCGHVRGLGSVTVVYAGREEHFSRNSSFSLDLLRSGQENNQKTAVLPAHEKSSKQQGENINFWQQTRRLEEDFNSALSSSDYRASINCLLQLDRALSLAQREFESEEDISQGRELYRELLVLLGLEMQRQKSECSVFQKLVDSLLSLRLQYRQEKRWEEADILRSILGEAGIEIHDEQDSTSWQIREEKG